MSFTDDRVVQASPSTRSVTFPPRDGHGSMGAVGVSIGRPEPGLYIVCITGELDMLTVPVVEERLRALFDAPPEHLIVNLERLEFLGSNGLTILLALRERAARAGTQMHLAGLVNRLVARPLEITNLTSLLSCHLTLGEARAACGAKEQPRGSEPSALHRVGGSFVSGG